MAFNGRRVNHRLTHFTDHTVGDILQEIAGCVERGYAMAEERQALQEAVERALPDYPADAERLRAALAALLAL